MLEELKKEKRSLLRKISKLEELSEETKTSSEYFLLMDQLEHLSFELEQRNREIEELTDSYYHGDDR